MRIKSQFFVPALILLLLMAGMNSFACSMCKVTINGRTYLGNNEDSWGMNSRIWFEKGPSGKLGALYVGYGNAFPQGGMNEAGLAFDGLTIYPKTWNPDPSKKIISNPAEFVKEIMQTCRTVEDVRRYAIQFNRQPFNKGELLFADRSGNYLVMEPDTMIVGHDDKYIIANFCPSITPDNEKLNWGRYARGYQFINNHKTDTGSFYTLALVDTMHECRKSLGDGTMYSFVADLEKGNFSLYFYHDYKHEVKFNLQEELAKGDHVLQIPALFPTNNEYEKLKHYKIPQNNLAILAFLYFCGGIFLFSTLYFLIGFFRNKKKVDGSKVPGQNYKLLLSALSAILLYYVIVLARTQAIFYSPAPYQDYKFSMLNIAAYIPFLLLLLLVPLLRINIRWFTEPGRHFFSKFIFTVNSLTYLALVGLFFYWGLYNIF